MIIQMKNTRGNWPTKKETFVNNYLQIFVKFVKYVTVHICNDTLL